MSSSPQELLSTPQAQAALALLAAAWGAAEVRPGYRPLPLPPALLLEVGLEEAQLEALCREGLLERVAGGYTLTEEGAGQARRLREAEASARPAPAEGGPAYKPAGHGQDGELRLGDQLVKRLPLRASVQAAVLAAFEREGWRAEIDNPLPGPRKRALARLRNAARHLSCYQGGAALEFCVSGCRIGWRIVKGPLATG
jgi:hypothetical protein